MIILFPHSLSLPSSCENTFRAGYLRASINTKASGSSYVKNTYIQISLPLTHTHTHTPHTHTPYGTGRAYGHAQCNLGHRSILQLFLHDFWLTANRTLAAHLAPPQ